MNSGNEMERKEMRKGNKKYNCYCNNLFGHVMETIKGMCAYCSIVTVRDGNIAIFVLSLEAVRNKNCYRMIVEGNVLVVSVSLRNGYC
jgi:hypothetical protein